MWWQVNTGVDTNLKFTLSIFNGTGTTRTTFTPAAKPIMAATNDAYASAPVSFNVTVEGGLHVVIVQSVAQVSNDSVSGTAFPVYGSVVRT